MKIDFNAVLNTLIIAGINQENPMMAKILMVFAKKEIPVMEAMAMLLEIAEIIKQEEKEE